MKNIEKYGNQIIEYANCNSNFCLQVRRWRMNDPKTECPVIREHIRDEGITQAICEICEAHNAAWLLEDAAELDWESLEAGTILRCENPHYEGETLEYEFVHFYDGDVWLRRRWDDESHYNFMEDVESLKVRLPELRVVKR